MSTAVTTRILEPVLKAWERAEAFQYLQRFHRFAEICGCDTPTNRADVRRAIIHATMEFDLKTFIEKRNLNLTSLETISRMECPVMRPDKTMQKVHESMPKQILFSCKRLRLYFNLAETLTCRGCTKRKRCKWFRAVVDVEPAADVADVARVLFGLSQYCRYHLQNPEEYPPIAPDFSAPTDILENLEAFVQGNQDLLYPDIPRADDHTARQHMINSSKEKYAAFLKRREERILNLPDWMKESVTVINNNKNLSKRQRQELLAQADAKEKTDDWVAEGEETKFKDSDLVEIDDVRSMPLPKRFEYLDQREDNEKKKYSMSFEQNVEKKKKEEVEINLDNFQEDQEKMNATEGGYTIVDMLDPRNFESMPEAALDALNITRQGLSGVHYYNTTGRVGAPSSLFDKKVIQEMWSSSSNFDPPFLKRIPFDTPYQRSGGALPPSTLHALTDTFEQTRTVSSSSSDEFVTKQEVDERAVPIFGQFTKPEHMLDSEVANFRH